METWQIWGDVATWVTGIATIALFIIGFLQIRNERISRIKIEKDLENRQIRAQAELVSSWKVKETRNWTWIAVLNHSPQPIYKVIVSLVRLDSIDGNNDEWAFLHQTYIAIAPVGLGYIRVPVSSEWMHLRLGVEIAFRDASGRNWIRWPHGELSQIAKSAVDHYSFPSSSPPDWIDLETSLPPDEIITPNTSSD